MSVNKQNLIVVTYHHKLFLQTLDIKLLVFFLIMFITVACIQYNNTILGELMEVLLQQMMHFCCVDVIYII